MYIVIEGIDGSGKSSLIKLLKKELSKYRIMYVKEPWKFKSETISAITNSLAYNEDRKELHSRLKNLEPHFDAIISDRSFISTMVYNSNDEYTPEHVLLDSHECLFPDLVVYLRCNPLEASIRAGENESELEHYFKKYEGVINMFNYLPIDTTRVSSQHVAHIVSEQISKLISKERRRCKA